MTDPATTELQACLPSDLRMEATVITPVAAGLSGAGVYRVEAAGQVAVLKLAGDAVPLADWQSRLRIQELAASAGLAPRILHADEARRAVVTAFVVDRSFPALLMTPTTRATAIDLLGRTLARVHALPAPADAPSSDPRASLATLTAALAGFALPGFLSAALERTLAEVSPAGPRRPVVLSHNDVNPTNLVFDGEHLLLLDWDMAGTADPLYDLAAISVFLRMDEATCAQLIAAHDAAPIAPLPAQFTYLRRLVAVLCGAAFLGIARRRGHPGATGTETLEATAGLVEIYQRLRAGTLAIAGADGQWAFGLALIKASC